jgi:hypothetical protein
MESFQRLKAAVIRELLELARRRTAFVLRTGFAALLGAIVIGGFSVSVDREAEAANMLAYKTFSLFYGATWMQAIVVLAISSFLGVASAQSERRNRTLGLLLLSRLHYWEIVVGKAVALLGLVGMIVIVGLPLFGLIGWAGGLDYAWLARSAVLWPVLALLGLALGLAFGFWFRFSLAAAIAALFSCIGLMMLPRLGALWFGTHWFDPLRPFSIGTAIGAVATQGTQSKTFWEPVVLTLAFSALALWIGARALRRVVSRGVGRGMRGAFEQLDRGFDRINVGGVRFELGRARGAGRQPVSWLSRSTAGMNRGRWTFRVLFINVCLSLVLASGIAVDASWAFTASFVIWPLLLMLPLHAGATAFATERANKSLVPLLSTPLTGAQLVRGKLFAVIQRVALIALPPALLMLWAHWLRSPIWFGRFGAANWVTLIIVAGAQSLGAFFIALGPSLLVANALRAGIASILLLGAVNAVPALVGMFVYGSLGDGDTWAVIGALFLLGIVVTLALLYMTRFRGRPGWDLSAFAVTIMVVAGLVGGLPIGREPTFEFLADLLSANVPFVEHGEPTLYSLYVVAAALLSWRYIVTRFDRLVGRTS